MAKEPLPRWDLKSLFESFESEAYKGQTEKLQAQVDDLEKLAKTEPKQPREQMEWLGRYLSLSNSSEDLYDELYSFAYMHYSSDTTRYDAVAAMNALDGMRIPQKMAQLAMREVLASLTNNLSDLYREKPELKDYDFIMREQLYLRAHQMGRGEEELAQDLLRSGGDLWGRLQEAVSSGMETVWDAKTGKKKTVVELRSLAHDPDRKVRKKAFDKELELWKTMEIPLAFALNGVKGFSATLNKRRKYETTLERSVKQSRLTRKALDALTGSITDALPDFQRYLGIKAELLGIKKCAFYDIFAPVGDVKEKWGWEKTRTFITRQFTSFSPELGEFAAQAFSNGWLDAEPRKGKVGGAYCISLPLSKASRVLANFDGSFSSVTTIAHELGHAYHHHVLRDTPSLLRAYPMTLAETASIFSETLVMNGAIRHFKAREKLAAIEVFLADSTQVTVDILSRFQFESDVMARRDTGELSPADFCEAMVKAQKATYGEALDKDGLHPYMWAVKGHYYSPERAFYNFPYAFGLLFALGLFARYNEEGPSFASTYRGVLTKSGNTGCVELCAELGFDIEERGFWDSSLGIIKGRIDEFEKLAGKK